jgi:hypothetical protein
MVYGSAVGVSQENGMWDAFTAGLMVSVLIILTGSVVSAVSKAMAPGTKKEK